MSERRGVTFERLARMKEEYADDDDVLDVVHAVEQLAATSLQRQVADLKAERDKWEKSAGIWETEAVDLLQDRTRAETRVADLQQQLAKAAGETEAAKQAAREIMAERNTWARQLADMRDERDTARDETNTQRDRYITASVDRDNMCVEIERVIEGASRGFTYPDEQIVTVRDLRRALAQWLTT